MIPISRWLAERDAPAAFGFPVDMDFAGAEAELSEGTADNLPTEEERAFQRGLSEGMAAAEAGFAERLEMERRAAAIREEELAEVWVQRCGETIANGLEEAVARLQTEIEQALHDALLPFLDDSIRKHAIAELLRMIRHELADTGDQPVEVKAPSVVLAHLKDELARIGIGAALTEASTVEVRARGRTVMFESMAGRWIETLQGHQGHE